MTDFENALKQAYKIIDEKYKYMDTSDLKQEVALVLWENPDFDDLQKVVSDVSKRLYNDEAKHRFNKAEHIYNDDGECVDDDIYFVDQSTVEQYGEGRRIDDELLEKGQKITKTWNTLNKLIRMCYKGGKGNDLSHYTIFLKTVSNMATSAITNTVKITGKTNRYAKNNLGCFIYGRTKRKATKWTD